SPRLGKENRAAAPFERLYSARRAQQPSHRHLVSLHQDTPPIEGDEHVPVRVNRESDVVLGTEARWHRIRAETLVVVRLWQRREMRERVPRAGGPGSVREELVDTRPQAGLPRATRTARERLPERRDRDERRPGERHRVALTRRSGAGPAAAFVVARAQPIVVHSSRAESER